MLRLHANLYAAPAVSVVGPSATLRGLALPTLRGEDGGPPRFLEPLGETFEGAQAALAALPRCDCEPDGFFLLTGHEGERFWRLNGHMSEYEERLHRVELNGECPEAALATTLGCLGADAAAVFELVAEGVTLSRDDFLRYAAAADA